jgi:hypothetical protein
MNLHKSKNTTQIMQKLLTFFILLFTFNCAIAQTDTGGGMGGTGIKEKNYSSQLLDAAGLKKRNECALEVAVGIIEIEKLDARSSTIKKPVCSNELITTQEDEKAVIYFRNGLKIELKPSSKIVINGE